MLAQRTWARLSGLSGFSGSSGTASDLADKTDEIDHMNQPSFPAFPASPDRLAPKNYARSEGKSGEGVKGAIEQWPKQDMGIFSRSTVRLAHTSQKLSLGSA